MKRGVIRRIDLDLDVKIKDIAKSCNLPYREASREISRIIKKGNKEVIF